MEMKYVVPDMAQSFGILEFAGESEPVFEKDKNNRRVLTRRSYNLYSDVQKGENVVVEIPVQAGEKHFKQKTAYEILTCDWSSDVCSSDLLEGRHRVWTFIYYYVIDNDY